MVNCSSDIDSEWTRKNAHKSALRAASDETSSHRLNSNLIMNQNQAFRGHK